MKIGIMHVAPAEENSPDAEIIKTWDRLLRKNMGLVKAADTEVTFQIPRRGINPDAGQYKYMRAFNDIETLQGYMELERAGIYDAIIIMCFLDPMLREAKQAVDVPFFGPCEVATRIAPMMGAKFGVVSPGEKERLDADESILRYGLREQAVPGRSMAISLDELPKCLTDSHVIIKAFIEASKKLIADGADVIIPGCMQVDPALRLAPGCEKEYPDGLKEVDGVPVMNVVALTIKMAEAFVTMKKAGSPWISRKLYYASAKGDKKALEMGTPLLEYTGPGFWLD
jgi:allantoin racemase